ncbi:uncharacterized protein LOC141633871 [Silene latifolia]|uniref:uncharacterized protein LOC141633871 n=1 Tax=Silene latifolia TaxID=37657 RepID=UPI003D77F530
MSKAYDRLRWNFIEATLIHMGFPHSIISLIMDCIKTVSYEVVLNGVPGTAFQPKTGIRQGDPLSPYIFALCTEVLSQLLINAQDSYALQGIQICRSAPSISHLLFADDSIFFIHADTKNCQSLQGILDEYCFYSGQQINYGKSAVSFSPNCTLRTITDCLRILKVPGGNSMGKYLGLPTDFGSSKKEVFAQVVQKVCKRLLSWNNVFLSSAGRLTLISSVLSSLSTYSLSAFRMPVSVISKIDALISQFWWGGSQAGKGINWCSRLFLHSSKRNGGLGIRHSGCLNQSLLAKLGWKIVTNSSCLFSRFFGSKYKITKDAVLKPNFTVSGPLSWGGRGIKWGLELLRNNLSWQVGFPSSLDLWRDKWIQNSSLAQLLPLSTADLQQKPLQEVSLLQLVSGHWNYDAVLNICGPTITPLVCSIAVPSEDTEDFLYWNLTPTGKYSSKSGYAVAFSKLWLEKSTLKDRTRMAPSTIAFCSKGLWRLPIINKWKLFLWKLLSNSLPCGEEAQSRNLQWTVYCSVCNSQASIESLTHLFRDCPSASRIWAGSPLGLRSNVGSSVTIQQWIVNWLTYFRRFPNSTSSISFFVSTLWHIWCFRNKLIFQGIPIDYYSLFTVITIDANSNIQVETERRKSISASASHPISLDDVEDSYLLRNHFPLCIIGQKICSTHIRIKCDASWKPTLQATAGWLFQNAEALALKYACDEALAQGHRHIDATSDCLNLVLQLNGCGDVNHDASSVLSSIMSLVCLCHCFSLSHCPRRLNRIAHAIAKSIA